MRLKPMVSAKFFHPAVATKLSHHDAKACGVRLFSQLLPCGGFPDLRHNASMEKGLERIHPLPGFSLLRKAPAATPTQAPYAVRTANTILVSNISVKT
jgi:hypothetical protein